MPWKDIFMLQSPKIYKLCWTWHCYKICILSVTNFSYLTPILNHHETPKSLNKLEGIGRFFKSSSLVKETPKLCCTSEMREKTNSIKPNHGLVSTKFMKTKVQEVSSPDLTFFKVDSWLEILVFWAGWDAVSMLGECADSHHTGSAGHWVATDLLRSLTSILYLLNISVYLNSWFSFRFLKVLLWYWIPKWSNDWKKF